MSNVRIGQDTQGDTLTDWLEMRDGEKRGKVRVLRVCTKTREIKYSFHASLLLADAWCRTYNLHNADWQAVIVEDDCEDTVIS